MLIVLITVHMKSAISFDGACNKVNTPCSLTADILHQGLRLSIVCSRKEKEAPDSVWELTYNAK